MPDIASACTLSEGYNYTIRTFHMWLAEIDDVAGTVGTEYLVGNIVTGDFVDIIEYFDTFNPLGLVQEPQSVGVRSGLRLSFATDDITCRNLQWMFSQDATLVAGSDRIGLDVIVPNKIFRATLEHTMPCGHMITVRLHRAAVISPLNYLFAPSTVHTLDFQLRAHPDDAETNVFGYWDITPNACALS